VLLLAVDRQTPFGEYWRTDLLVFSLKLHCEELPTTQEFGAAPVC